MDLTRTQLNAQTLKLRVPGSGTLVLAVLVLVLGFFLIYPAIIVLLFSFNTARDVFVGPVEWGLDNWRAAYANPMLLRSLLNTFWIFGSVLAISFPTAVLIAWTLARVRIPFSHGLEFLFWIAYMMPGIAVAVGWVMLADHQIGILNTLLRSLSWFDSSPLRIHSVPGIVWVHLMSGAVAQKVMLMTPAFRNMDAALEEAARVSGSSNLRTMFRVTLPVMLPIMALVFALQMLHLFRSFEIEQILGVPVGVHVYSTMLFSLMRADLPQHGQATALASITLGVVAPIIPLQRWLITRRRYTTITGSFRPGLIDIGPFRYVAFGSICLFLFVAVAVPIAVLVFGSFMNRVGFFGLPQTFTLRHWEMIFADGMFINALLTTFVLSATTAVVSPVLFSLIGYMLVRTKWRGRLLIDSMIWISGAIPGMLSGLGLMLVFITTPGLVVLYGSLMALIIVVVLQGNTTGIQLAKAAFIQIGQDMEDQARISGAGWIGTYFRIWIPLLMPTLVLLGVLNFVIAANTTSSIILLAARDTQTLSILALFYSASKYREAAGIVSMFIIGMTVGVALIARLFGVRMGVKHL